MAEFQANIKIILLSHSMYNIIISTLTIEQVMYLGCLKFGVISCDYHYKSVSFP